MADDSDIPDAPALPPKLNLRKQGILKKEPVATPGSAPKQETSRLVVKPAPAPVEPTETEAPTPAPAAAPSRGTPAIRLQPLKPKPTLVAPPPDLPPAPAPEAEEKPADPKPPSLPGSETGPIKANTKRKTARIPLGSAKLTKEDGLAAVDGQKPKTIKIKPAAPLPKIRSTQPLSITLPLTDMADESHGDAAKRQTSRIPLEEALTADKISDEAGETSDPARPKTIKIKRPGSADAATAKPNKGSAASEGGTLGETARLDNLPLDLADNSPTQKKTIRVKRPQAAGGAPALSTSPVAAPAGRGLMPPEPFEEASDEPGVAWALLAVAATLVLCTVI